MIAHGLSFNNLSSLGTSQAVNDAGAMIPGLAIFRASHSTPTSTPYTGPFSGSSATPANNLSESYAPYADGSASPTNVLAQLSLQHSSASPDLMQQWLSRAPTNSTWDWNTYHDWLNSNPAWSGGLSQPALTQNFGNVLGSSMLGGMSSGNYLGDKWNGGQ